VGANLKDGTAMAPTDLSGAVVDTNGDAWHPPAGFTVAAAVKGTGDAADQLTIYTYEGGSNRGTHNHVVQYSFTFDSASGYYRANEDSVDGVEMSAVDLAASEVLAKRDFNNDGVYGVSINGAADSVGGLYRASALGNDFLVVGRSVTSSASKPFNLSTALLNSDGSAWMPDDMADTGAGSLKIVTQLAADKSVAGFDVYAKEDSGTYAKYSFGADYKLNESGRVELSLDDLANAEKVTGRDLNGDGAFGAVVSRTIDLKGGLHEASFDTLETVYLKESKVLPAGSKMAARAVGLDNALRTEDGNDYWNLDDPESFRVISAYSDNDGYHVIAQSQLDSSVFQRNNFDESNQLVSSEDIGLGDVVQAESATKRDLNGDGITGVKIASTADKVGGLQIGNAAGRSFLLVGANAKAVTDLSTALVTADGAAWGVGQDGAFDASLFDPSTDKLVLSQRDSGGLDLFVSRTVDGSTTVKQYTFDENRALVEDDNTGATVSGIALADAEKDISRDLNGDRSIGAKLSLALDKTGGLYKAQLDGHDFYVVSSNGQPSKGMSLSDKVLLSGDGQSAWQPDEGGTVTGIVSTDNGNYQVYVSTSDGITQHTFDANRVYQDSESLTASDVAHAEKLAGRDLSGDKTVGVKIASPTDRTGKLYRAEILGQSFFVVGANLKTGKDADSAIDLSKALLDADGNAWASDTESGYSVVGGLELSNGGYAVYTSKKDESGNVVSVRRSTWDPSFTFEDTAEADPVELVSLETDKHRDFSGDGVVGFKVLSTKSIEDYKGVTEATISGDTKFWLVGDAVKQGSKSNPLSLRNALLNEDGTGPWYLDSSYFVKAVDDSGEHRQVYVTNNSSEVLRFSFDKSTGRVLNGNEPTAVTAVDLAQKEVSLKRDLNDDGYKGATSVVALGGTGLLTVGILDQNFLVVGKAPAPGKSIDLSSALLDGNGNAWQAPDSVTLKGVYKNASDDVEVYGVDGEGAINRYTFSKNQDGTLSLKDGGEETLSGTTLALREGTALKDLNGDGRIGFKSDDQAIATQSNGWALGRAGVGSADTDQIYIVGRNLGQMGVKANNLANNAALVESLTDGIPTYWKPDEGYDIKSIVQVSDGSTGLPKLVSIYAKQSDPGSDASDDYVKYDFLKGEGEYWTLQAVSEESKGKKLSSRTLVSEEVTSKRDLNGDGAYGLTVGDGPVVSGAFASLFSASIDSQNFLLVGSNLSTGSLQRPLGLSGLLLDAGEDQNAWQPPEGTSVAAFVKVTQAMRDAGGEALNDAVYVAKLDNDSQVFFKAGENNTFVKIDGA